MILFKKIILQVFWIGSYQIRIITNIFNGN